MTPTNTINVISDDENEILRLTQRVIDESPDLIAVIGTDCRYHYVNPAYVRIHRKQPRDFAGVHIREFLGDDVFEHIVEPRIKKCLAGEIVRYEAPFDFGEAGSFYMEVQYLPLFDSEGKVDRIVIVTRNVTGKKDAENGFRKSTEFLYNIINALDDPVFVKDHEYRYHIVNSKLCAALGLKSENIVGKTDFDLYNHDEAEVFRKTDQFVLNTSQTNVNEEEVTWLGFTFTVSTKKSLFIDSQTGRRFIVGAMRDITERKLAEEKLAYIATHDALTGIPNRSLFNELLASALLLASRNQYKLAVMLLDLDKFKEVNDQLGHRVGDCLLQDVSDRLRLLLRKSDTVARMSGDEFLLLLPEIHQSEEADHIAGKIVESLQTPFFCDGNDLRITCSIGISLYPDDGHDTETIIRHADIAMYVAKRGSRNAYRRFSHEMAMDDVPAR